MPEPVQGAAPEEVLRLLDEIGSSATTAMGMWLLAEQPEALDATVRRVIERAVKRMITPNPLGRQLMRNLRVYAGAEHPHAAQNPETLDLAKLNSKNKRS
mgnify:CR=1 FL=1